MVGIKDVIGALVGSRDDTDVLMGMGVVRGTLVGGADDTGPIARLGPARARNALPRNGMALTIDTDCGVEIDVTGAGDADGTGTRLEMTGLVVATGGLVPQVPP